MVYEGAVVSSIRAIVGRPWTIIKKTQHAFYSSLDASKIIQNLLMGAFDLQLTFFCPVFDPLQAAFALL